MASSRETKRAEVGIIGGSGLGEMLTSEVGGVSVEIDTPFGPPSGPLVLAEWEGVPVAFLSRHGIGHVLNPSAVPYRANIWALKQVGVKTIIASGATGSLREEVAPGHLMLCDQVIDKTFKRASTFFDDGVVAHIALADPFCSRLRSILHEAGAGVDATVHPTGTYVCMEGPQFSTKAEANMHRQWGGDLIGMTCMPEAKLAREAELCYALVALPTDYDCWREPDKSTGPDELLREIIGNLKRGSEAAMALIREAIKRIAASPNEACACHDALKLAMWSDKRRIAEPVRERLNLLIGRYLVDEGGND